MSRELCPTCNPTPENLARALGFNVPAEPAQAQGERREDFLRLIEKHADNRHALSLSGKHDYNDWLKAVGETRRLIEAEVDAMFTPQAAASVERETFYRKALSDIAKAPAGTSLLAQGMRMWAEAALKAMPEAVERVPLTEVQILACWTKGNGYAVTSNMAINLARAIEAAHGIGAPATTGAKHD